MAIKHDCGDAGMATWLEWSQRSPKFELADAVDTWRSLQPKLGDGAITVATIYHRAGQAGWRHAGTGDIIPAEIAELNATHFVAPYGRKVPVFRERIDPVDGRARVEPFLSSDFRLLYQNRVVDVQIAGGRSKKVPLAEYWLKHPRRRGYEQVVFAPGQDYPRCYNLWRGFAVEPKKGTWRRMRWHICFVICCGDRRRYRYLLNWMAFTVQHPGRPAEVAVVLRGGRGSGKGVFARSLGGLFGPHFQHITQSRHLTGNFNGHLESCVLLFVDEGFWAGDKQGEGVLKGLVTEPTLSVERKGFDVVQTRNCLHIVVASNSDWVVPAGPDERRFFVLDVDESRKQESKYFGPLNAEMSREGLAAMLYDLQHRDISRFNIRRVPRTKALGEQKIQSMDPIHRWWFGVLVQGSIMDLSFGPRFEGVGEVITWGTVATQIVHWSYMRALTGAGVSRKSAETELGMSLAKLLPPGPDFRVRRLVGDKLVRFYAFPPLSECRAHFEKLMGLTGQIDWEAGEIME